MDPAFWNGRRVLVTGHTGFKGAWLTLWLRRLGAEVAGLSDAVPTEPSLFALARAGEGVAWARADVRDAAAVRAAVDEHAPDVVFHLAAQPLVRRSFAAPRETYEVNVMGAVNVLDAARDARVVVNVTSDKCYAPRDSGAPYREGDPLGGHDPYSSSKACSELVTEGFRNADVSGGRIASARAGNVIGGGDWAQDRLVPDFMRAAADGSTVRVRNPDAVRPWQHVLNPLAGYLALAEAAHADPAHAAAFNFGPDEGDARPVGWIAERLRGLWPGELRWEADPGPHPPEAPWLKLDSARARERLGWRPRWALDEALARVVEWHAAHARGEDMRAVTLAQIDAYAA
jgi:CDP-glucose 4,6-dehydratase